MNIDRVSLRLMPRGRCKLVICVALVTVFQGCGPATAVRSTAADSPSSVSTTQAPSKAASNPKAQLTFVDLDSFDKQVEQALASGATEIEIQLLSGMSPNQIAPRLGRWLNTVQDNGGEIQVTGGPRTRSLGLLASLGEFVYKAWSEQRLQSLVKGVNAEMSMSGDKIEKVTFRRK